MSLFYCLVMGSLHSQKKKEEGFLKLKYCLYQLCEEFLSPEEQKCFVENMCLFQSSKKILDFLSKNKLFESLIIKIFQSYKEKVVSVTSAPFEKSEELKTYSSIFDFIQFEMLDVGISKITFSNIIFYIFSEKECYFVSHTPIQEQKL